MISIKAQLNKYRVRRDATYPLVFQLIYRRGKRLIYSPYHLFEKDFNEKKGKVIISRLKRNSAEEINDYINKTIQQIRQVVDLLVKQGNDFTTGDIVLFYKSTQDNNLLITYFHYQVQLLKEEGRIGTANAYQSTLNCLDRFIGSEKLFSFKDITEQWVNNYLCFLRSSGLKPNSVNLYFRILHAVYNKACKENIDGTSMLSPFRAITINNIKTQKKAVDKSIIQKMAGAEFGDNFQKGLARDLFLFSFYCRGMPFVDMAHIKYNNIIDGYICYSRQKTGQPLKVKITGMLQDLIDKYKTGGDYILPILESRELSLLQQYSQYKNRLRQHNKTLKAISNSLNLPLNLSSYVPRHSWATLARENEIPVSVISEGMGHSSEKVTYVYLAALNPSHIDDANEKVMNDCFPN